ncbi:MAG TPA: HU family DNA-binding protein [Candidatus Omnitrophica bacterium]|nr:MAG: DNA-binding protein [Candidatus Omnitrophota bacterium]RKY34164.1 MAG: DNA-binding protein [Candidatus Omnitrophota bacterium]RKY43960.1 MAG: DNA-binding protein [Candidatus Omnitrophota bacterium]HEC68835.1 HU family DNA-binding protein [Candidatus Omnitrophota bacterium]
MNKAQLIAKVAEKTETKKQAQEIVELILDTIKSTLKKREPVAISGFGTFKVKETKPRTGRNPKTGETIQIPAKKKLSFRVSKELKSAII